MSEESFLREVEDELRSEKLRRFWRRYAPFIIGAGVLIVLLVAGNEIWKWWRASTAADGSDRFYQAVDMADAGDLAGSRAALEALAAEGPQGYATLARFRAAATRLAEGDNQGAAAEYDVLASSLGEPRLRELALVLGAYAAVDLGDPGAIETRVGTIADSDGPFRNQAREAIGLARYGAGDIEAARERFESIAADAGASQELQIRAFLYLDHLAAAGVAVDPELIGEGEAMPLDPGTLPAMAAPDGEAAPLPELVEPAGPGAPVLAPEAPAEISPMAPLEAEPLPAPDLVPAAPGTLEPGAPTP